MRTVSLITLVGIALAAPVSAQDRANDKSLRQADAMQMRIIVEENAKAQQDFMHPNYFLNAPSNRVMRKEQLVAMLAKGQMASESFERTIEATSITGNIGIVMRRETVTPAADSQLGRPYSFGSVASGASLRGKQRWQPLRSKQDVRQDLPNVRFPPTTAIHELAQSVLHECRQWVEREHWKRLSADHVRT